MELSGTVAFSTIGRPYYGFDVYSVELPSDKLEGATTKWVERRLTDGQNVNFNGQFVDEDRTLVYISERTGGVPRVFVSRRHCSEPEMLPAIPESFFLDRPILKNDRLYLISAHDPVEKPPRSWTAVYSVGVLGGSVKRLTPKGVVDYSPALSRSGQLVAVASYGLRQWHGMDYFDLATDVVVFPESDPERRTVIAERGGWPTWSGDSTVFFHRKTDDGWWSIFRVDLPKNLDEFDGHSEARRVTPPGVHAFTPVASHNNKWLAFSTRRPGTEFRQVEIFDLETESFIPVTSSISPEFHHYNPFFSPESGFLGYHRFRGDSSIPHLDPIQSPVDDLRLVRVNGDFPGFSPDGRFIAFNPDFDTGFERNSGLRVIRADGSKRWTILKDRMAFTAVWSPTEEGVIYTSLGMIFEPISSSVQVARVKFNLADLEDHRVEVPSEVTILTRVETGNNAFPSVSPDGKSLVFRSGRSGHKNLYIMDSVEGEFNGKIRRLTEGPWIDTMPCWSPCGEWIGFSSNRHKPEDPEVFSIYFVRPDGTGLRRIPLAGPEGSEEADRERNNHVVFNKDTTWMLFTSNMAGLSAEPIAVPQQFNPFGDIFVCKVDGTELQRLTFAGYENGTPAWDHRGVAVMGRPHPEPADGDKLEGQFEDVKWVPFPKDD
ncbi:hypothetical protein H6P81_000511 [Aristolochia fimbriata]|uniref:TolB protein n=1 Tax=Aristolochia fimbriata TaxID=158543 RepID=A0AAV7F8U6_ARIFI|nr:hypothetical protein H6P81_000511 [Aristolochia fimbriata]